MPEELFDVCNEQDRVIGQEVRSVVHAQNLLHRAVHIWVWNTQGELMIHLRSQWKDQFPLCFTSSSSGHVDAGETYEDAAKRELWEELRLSGTLTYVTKLPGSAATAYEHTVLYFLTTDELPTPDPEEIQEILYFRPMVLAEMVRDEPERFTPPFRELMAEFERLERSGETRR